MTVQPPPTASSIGTSKWPNQRGLRYSHPSTHAYCLFHARDRLSQSRNEIGYTGRLGEDGRVLVPRTQMIRRVSGQHHERLAGCPQLSRDGLGGLAAEVDVEDGDIAPPLRNQPQCFRHGRRRPHDFETGIGKLLADVEANHKLILYHKYADAHDLTSATAVPMLSSRSRCANSSSTFDEGHTRRQRSPVGGRSRSTSPSRLDSAIVFMTVEPKPRRLGATTVGPPHSVQLMVKTPLASPRCACQRISTWPESLESAPYFAAFVASSCMIMPNVCAATIDNRNDGPSSFILVLIRSLK